MTKSDDIKTQSWTRLVRAYQYTYEQIEQTLKAEKLPPLTWYDILLEADREPEAGLRLYELEERLLLKQYGVSRLVDRMEKAGYLEKRRSEEDGRGYRIFITDLGKETRQKMWKVYAPAMEAYVVSKLTYDEARQLNLILAKLLP